MVNPLEMIGRRILVTGASSGIGRETAVLLSQLGANLLLVGRDLARLEETRTLLVGEGHRIESFDLGRVDDIPDWLKRIASEFGTLSGVVHCAGVQSALPIRAVSASQVARMTEINVTAAFMLAKGLRQKPVLNPPASLVFVSSVMGLVGTPGRSVYSATKGALISMTRSLAIELAREGLRVNCVAPAFIETPMFDEIKNMVGSDGLIAIQQAHPLGIGKPRDVANAIAFLLAQTGRWITGSTLVVDGGYTAQ